MARKRLAAEQIVTKLRQIEVLQAQGKTIAVAWKEAGTTEQKLRDECLNREIFYSFKEAQGVIEKCRIHSNTKRPHSSLGSRPPASPAFVTNSISLDERSNMQ